MVLYTAPGCKSRFSGQRRNSYPAGLAQNRPRPREPARRLKQIDLNRWPTGHGDGIRTLGRRGGSCDCQPRGRLRRGGGDLRGHTPPSLRAERGVGAMDNRTADGGLMRYPGPGPGGRPAGRRRRRTGAPSGTLPVTNVETSPITIRGSARGDVGGEQHRKHQDVSPPGHACGRRRGARRRVTWSWPIPHTGHCSMSMSQHRSSAGLARVRQGPGGGSRCPFSGAGGTAPTQVSSSSVPVSSTGVSARSR
jgi:hypothetical protein